MNEHTGLCRSIIRMTAVLEYNERVKLMRYLQDAGIEINQGKIDMNELTMEDLEELREVVRALLYQSMK